MQGSGNIPEHVVKFLESRSKDERIAVVGASANPEKYGYRIVENLLRKGYNVAPVNPREKTIAGVDAYPTVKDIPGKVAIVDIVLPPAVARELLDELQDSDIQTIFFQPGSWNEETVRHAQKLFSTVIYDNCIMQATDTIL